MFTKLFCTFFISLILFYPLKDVLAITNPLNAPNNKFGIHLIQATVEETQPAMELVNSSGGDWGYITVLIEQNDKKKDKWQAFFDDLRRKRLIPIVRLATKPAGDTWMVPSEGEEKVWADFLDSLNWPVKNRYVVIYNEPNHGAEWGGAVDPEGYAKVLDKTIDALKAKNPNFFVLNAGLDASTPNEPPRYLDEVNYLTRMNLAVPGIFNKLDGWVSHSYPNPNFAGSPYGVGKGTVGTWRWELQYLGSLGLNKALPVFITETGWKHAEGVNFDSTRVTSEVVGAYLKEAFNTSWNDPQIVVVTPFLLSYLNPPFDHFSFKRPSTISNTQIIDELSSKYYPQYKMMMDLPKLKGSPLQVNKAKHKEGSLPSDLVIGENYNFTFKFENTGGSIWDQNTLLKTKTGDLVIEPGKLPTGQKVEPGQVGSFTISFKAPQSGSYKTSLVLFQGETEFEMEPLEYSIEAQSPVVLLVHSLLGWRDDPSGDYTLQVSSDSGTSYTNIKLNNSGTSEKLEAKYLLPDYEFKFTLSKPFYHSKTITQTVHSGINNLYFDRLEPDLLQGLLNPPELWKLLPWGKI